jgi:hypothetical protein
MSPDPDPTETWAFRLRLWWESWRKAFLILAVLAGVAYWVWDNSDLKPVSTEPGSLQAYFKKIDPNVDRVEVESRHGHLILYYHFLHTAESDVTWFEDVYTSSFKILEKISKRFPHAFKRSILVFDLYSKQYPNVPASPKALTLDYAVDDLKTIYWPRFDPPHILYYAKATLKARAKRALYSYCANPDRLARVKQFCMTNAVSL